MSNGIKRILCGITLALGVVTMAVPASAATAQPLTADNCGLNGDGFYNCMYVAGGGLRATEIRGWSQDQSGTLGPFHEQVVGPSGNTICNSNTVDASGNRATIASCQTNPNANVAAGSYCSIVWFDYLGYYQKVAENCVTVSA